MTYHWYPYTNDCIVKRINFREGEIPNGSTNGDHREVDQQRVALVPTTEKPDFAEERERLLKEDPCDRAHVASVNQKEVAYYRKACAKAD